MKAFLLRTSVGLLAALVLGGALRAESWWERGADTWYYKDDWKGLALEGSRAYSRSFDLPGGGAPRAGEWSGGWIVVWGDRGYALKLNGKPVGDNIDGGLIDDYDLKPFIEAGAAKVTLLIEGSRVCAEGELIDAKGKRHAFATGEDWQTADGRKPKTRKLEPGPSHGAFHRAHNGRIVTYNDEERGKAAIARCLARIQKLNDRSLFIMRRLRPAEDILSFDPDVPWRRAERAAAPLIEKARGIITGRAIPAQKAGRFAQASAAAHEAAIELDNAEAVVSTVAELYRAEREMTHLENCWSLLGGNRGPGEQPPDMSDPGSPGELREQATKPLALGDWAATLKVARDAQEHSVESRKRLEGAAARILGPLVGGLGHLDEFPEDRFGWLNARELMGNDPARWPFTMAPSACDYIDLAGLWEFHTDPDNLGVDRLKDGWRTLFAPEPWERQGVLKDNLKSPGDCPYKLGDARTGDKPYNGFAWYRKSVLVPADWRGKGRVMLATGTIHNWGRVFLNGEPLADGKQNPPATHELPAGLIRFGGENLIAIQVYNHDNFGGITGGSLATYVAGAEPDVVETPGPLSFVTECSYRTKGGRVRHTFLASAMSPAVVAATDGPAIELWGWEAKGSKPPSTLAVITGLGFRSVPIEQAAEIQKDAHGPGKCLVLQGGERETLIVLEEEPTAIAWKRNALGAMGLSIPCHTAVRAAAFVLPSGVRLDEAACRFWARALRRIPVAASQLVYTEKGATDRSPAPAHATRFRYLNVNDIRGGDFLTVAPVPMLFSYAMEHKHPGLAIEGAKPTGYRSPYAPYLLVENSSAVRYRAPAVDRSKVMKGVGELFGKIKPEHNARGGLPEDVMFKRMGEWGFDHCRYAFAFHANWDLPLVKYMGGPIIEDNEAAWKRLDQLIEKTNAAGMQMMLCWFFNEDQPQADTGGAVRNSTRYWQARPETQKNAFELWRRIAARYADKPEWAISYDFFNEPAYVNPAHWNQVIKELTAVIRSADKRHMIVWESADGWAQPQWCLWMEPAKDPNVLYSFHHYGKHWGYAYDEYYPGYKRTHEQSHVDPWLHAILFGIRHHVPIHCGEFGISMIQPAGSGEAWLNDYLALFERFGIGWNWWNYSGGDIYRTGLAARNRISPFVPILRKWAEESGWGAVRRKK